LGIIINSMRTELTNVHTLVNSQHSDMVDRIDQLIDALLAAGVDVPRDPNAKKVRQ
jgi:hypothetical protein